MVPTNLVNNSKLILKIKYPILLNATEMNPNPRAPKCKQDTSASCGVSIQKKLMC